MPESTLEERIASLEGSYKELTKRIDDLREETHRGLDLLRGEINALRGELSDLRSEFRSSFRWTMSLVLINWLSLLAAIFLVAGKK
jgi:predicted  nucleic acid-binding Zn-ribbon protein